MTMTGAILRKAPKTICTYDLWQGLTRDMLSFEGCFVLPGLARVPNKIRCSSPQRLGFVYLFLFMVVHEFFTTHRAVRKHGKN